MSTQLWHGVTHRHTRSHDNQFARNQIDIGARLHAKLSAIICRRRGTAAQWAQAT